MLFVNGTFFCILKKHPNIELHSCRAKEYPHVRSLIVGISCWIIFIALNIHSYPFFLPACIWKAKKEHFTDSLITSSGYDISNRMDSAQRQPKRAQPPAAVGLAAKVRKGRAFLEAGLYLSGPRDRSVGVRQLWHWQLWKQQEQLFPHLSIAVVMLPQIKVTPAA